MRPRPTWLLRGGALIVLLIAAAVVVLVSSSSNDQAQGTGSATVPIPGRTLPPVRIGSQPVTSVQVSDHTTARKLPQGFLSLSIEYSTVLQWTEGGSGAVPPVLSRLVQALSPSGQQVIRVGGQGGDRTWWPIKGVATPRGVSNALDGTWISAAKRVAGALAARYLLQINLEADSVRIARTEADHLLSGLGSADIAALEIGNEPELYRSIAWYWTKNGKPLPWYARTGTPVFAQPPSYGPSQFLAQWHQFAAAMPGKLALAGPDLVGTSWLPDAAVSMLAGSRALTYFDVHSYPLGCTRSPTSSRYPSVANLLALSSSRDLLDDQQPYIARAHAAGARFLDDELGSVSCGGAAGVSNSMASALWALDTLFAMDQAGVDGVDLHNLPSTVNALFDLDPGSRTARGAKLYPMYLGAVLFAQAAPAGSQLLSVSDSDEGDLRAWATRGPDGTVRVVVINDGPSRVASIRLPAAVGRGLATLERLHAHGAGSTRGFVLGGRAVDFTRTGDLSPLRDERVQRRNGTYEFEISSGSAALLTLPTPDGAGA